jgi:Bacterial Ig-like domain
MFGKLRLVCGATLLALVGGCGDGSVVIYFGPQPPAVTATAPQNGAVDVAPDTTVSAVFNQAMDPATIDGASFTLRTAAGFVSGQVNYDSPSRTARFTPDQPLPLLTTCTATLVSAIRSAAGPTLHADYIWSFTTRDGGAAGLVVMTADPGAPPLPLPTDLITSADGSTLQVWLESAAGGLQSVRAERYLAAEGRWSSPPGPLSGADEDCREVVVAGDAAGNALIAWVSERQGYQVVVSRYLAADDRWLTPAVVASEGKGISELRIAAGEGGGFSISWLVEGETLPRRQLLRCE